MPVRPIPLKGDILLVYNDNEKKIYINNNVPYQNGDLVAVTKIYDISNFKEDKILEMCIQIDLIRDSSNVLDFENEYLKGLDVKFVEYIVLPNVLTNYVENKISGIYAYQIFDIPAE